MKFCRQHRRILQAASGRDHQRRRHSGGIQMRRVETRRAHLCGRHGLLPFIRAQLPLRGILSLR